MSAVPGDRGNIPSVPSPLSPGNSSVKQTTSHSLSDSHVSDPESQKVKKGEATQLEVVTTVLMQQRLALASSSANTLPSPRDLERQDEEARRTYLTAHTQSHLDGQVVSTQEEIVFSPTTFTLEPVLLREIHHVLSKSFDMDKTPIKAITLVSEPERRNKILRIELKNTQKSVIFKESNPMTEQGKIPTDEEIRESYDRFARDWAGLEFANGLQGEHQLCPQCYGGSEKHRFLLLEDLGKQQVTLVDHLLKGKAPAAADSLGRYMTCLGRFHAAGHVKLDNYLEILHRINPQAPNIEMQERTETTLNDLRSALKILNLSSNEGLEEEAKKVVKSIYDPKGPFTTMGHGDPCPDNVFDYPDKLLLIDFEWASVESSLFDATYPRMNMPSGWCAGQFPEELLDKTEAIYREEMKKRIPAAADDRTYSEAYVHACAMHVLRSDMRIIQAFNEKDDTWGIAQVRSRTLSHLATFIKIAEKYDTLPSLRDTAKTILETLKRQWEGSKPLDLYPAFTQNT